MNLKLESYQKAVDLFGDTTVVRSDGRSILPTPLVSTIPHLRHNPSIELDHFIAHVHMAGRLVEHHNFAMCEYIDNFDQSAAMELVIVSMGFKELLFVRHVEMIREFILSTLYNVFREHPHSMPPKIRAAARGRKISYGVDAEFFDAVERHYSGTIFDIRKRVLGDLGVDMIPRRFSLLKMSRLNELRNCFVHHGGRKSTKFMRIAGAKYDRLVTPQGKLRPFVPWQTLMFIVRIAIDIEIQFLEKYELSRRYSYWPVD